jgi:hypothetical protein
MCDADKPQWLNADDELSDGKPSDANANGAAWQWTLPGWAQQGLGLIL